MRCPLATNEESLILASYKPRDVVSAVINSRQANANEPRVRHLHFRCSQPPVVTNSADNKGRTEEQIWFTTAMDFEISDSALDAIRAKGGTAAIDFIDPIG
jgi:hypothetical protein